MEHPERLDILRRTAAFTRLREQELTALAEATQAWSFQARDLLIRQGDPGDALWIMVSGAAEVRLQGREGTIVLAKLGPRDVFGEMALVTGAPRNADVVATEPGSALALSRAGFEAIAEKHPAVFAVLTELIASRLGRAAQDGLGDKVIEGYRILRPAGRGATAVVYEAEETASGRRTALKMLSHRFSRDVEAMAWFEHEASMLEHVAHPSIARSYGMFDAYGTRFLAIEFVDGPGVHEFVRVLGRLQTVDAVTIAGSVAAALGHVHERGVVHGDVKPANVMVDQRGRVLLTDFGIASRVDGAAEAVVGGAARLAGTPRYMAPELFVGSAASPGTDLYALGCVLFELLTGAAAFPAPDLGGLVLSKRRFEPAALLSMAADVPVSVRDTIGHLLDPDPARRPRSAKGLGWEPGPVASAVVADVLRRRLRETLVSL